MPAASEALASETTVFAYHRNSPVLLLPGPVEDNAHSSSTPSKPTRPWFDGKDHGQYMLAYHLDAEKRHNLSSHQLEDVCSHFLTKRNQQERADKENRWRMAIRCHEIITGNDDSSVATRKILGKLCDKLFRLEHGRCISRANFVRCMQQTAARMSTDDTNLLYSTFDPMKQNEVDWRMLVFMIYIAAEPSLSCKDILLHAFLFYIGNVDHLLDCPSRSGAIRIRDISLILDPLIQSSHKSEVLTYFDEAWGNIIFEKDHSVLCAEAASSTVSFNMFERMLDDSCIKTLFLEDTVLAGRGNLFFTICTFEHDYYPATLLKHVMKVRRASAVTRYLHILDMEQKKACMSEWKLYVSQRRHVKELVHYMAARLWNRQKVRGFRTLKRWALCHVAAVEIQRVARGFLGRIESRVRYIFTASSICLQSTVRRYLHRCQYLHSLQMRKNAAIELQRIVRGNIGRRIAADALLAKVEQERRDLQEEKNKWRQRRQRSAATAIQRVYRSKAVRVETRRRLCREASAMDSLEEERLRFRRERKVFEIQLQEFYKQEKDEKEAADARKARANRERIRIRNLQRRIVRNDLKSAANIQIAIDATNSQIQAAQYSNDWNESIKARGEECKKFCSRCLQDPRTAVERRTRSALNKKIKKRTFDVLKRADARQIEMEIAEAKIIARDEILELEAAEEEARVKEEWRMDSIQQADRRKKQAEEKKRFVIERRNMKEKQAALVLTTVYRRWSARRTLHKLCAEVYRKEFDEEHHAFYYRNMRTGLVTWEKLMSLGSSDLPTANVWKVLRDAQDFPYYYNPCTLDMSWQPPSDGIMCEATVKQPWLKEYPVALGPCEYFAAKREIESTGERKKLCIRCAAAASGAAEQYSSTCM